jgi:protein-tyrosine-phosphatase
MSESDRTPSVLFVGVKNGGKSQMAAGLMTKIAGDTVRVYSAGTKPGTAVNDLSAQALADVGVDITGDTPTLVDPHLVRDVDLVITLGREATSTRLSEPGSRTGTPSSPPNAASTASNACDWSATTSPPASPISSTESTPGRPDSPS